MIKYLCFSLALSALPILQTSSASADTSRITAHITFDGGTDHSEDEANTFQRALDLLDGQIIWLDLTLEHVTEADPLNSFSLSSYGPVAHTSPDQEENTCDNPGSITNFDQEFEVSFHRPADYHGHTSIFIGDRRQYPHQSLRCLLTDFEQPGNRVLQIRGYYIVDATLIRTAYDYTLYPANER
ncbi:hypothetical protein SAMN05877809_103161 [Rhodobacter sp. JA431]|uniref:hypothetical protein n=1 Tax=Rhodobacter sp. JA431 TaxID=570013 RepID=UPI000BC827B1|nr:hypothetical protein [Rhodobacter sp. JA431]SOC04235.1 hypothetical protein SAMN05877809_103161 [Rhodobacter sp. JA431]